MTVASILLLAAGPLASATYSSSAPVAYLTDFSSGATLVAEDADRRIPTASMAKMMTAWVAFERIQSGSLKLDQTFKVSDAAWQKWNNTGSSMFLKAGETVSVGNLLHGVLTLSGNDASVVLAEGIAGSETAFTRLMNAEAKKLGMANSRFETANGWPDQGKTYSTARDLAVLADRIIGDHPALFRQFFGQRRFSWNGVTQANRNPLLGAINGADGMKTGHSDEAGYCLVGTVKQGNRRLLMVVAGLPTQAARIDEARKMMAWGFHAWDSRLLYKKDHVVGRIPVQLGTQSQVDVQAPRTINASFPTGMGAIRKLVIKYRGPLKAPFKKGQQVAELVTYFSNGQIQSMPLVAGSSVAKAGFFGRAWNGVKSLVGAG